MRLVDGLTADAPPAVTRAPRCPAPRVSHSHLYLVLVVGAGNPLYYTSTRTRTNDDHIYITTARVLVGNIPRTSTRIKIARCRDGRLLLMLLRAGPVRVPVRVYSGTRVYTAYEYDYSI